MKNTYQKIFSILTKFVYLFIFLIVLGVSIFAINLYLADKKIEDEYIAKGCEFYYSKMSANPYSKGNLKQENEVLKNLAIKQIPNYQERTKQNWQITGSFVFCNYKYVGYFKNMWGCRGTFRFCPEGVL